MGFCIACSCFAARPPHTNGRRSRIARGPEEGSVLECAVTVAEALSIPRLEREVHRARKMQQLGVLAHLLTAGGKRREAWALVERVGQLAGIMPPGMARIAVASIRGGDFRGAEEAVTKLSASYDESMSAALARVAAEYLSVGKVGDAHEVALKIRDAKIRGQTLVELGVEAHSVDMITSAVSTIGSIPVDSLSYHVPSSGGTEYWFGDYSPRFEAMVAVAHAYASLGEIEKATDVLAAMETFDDLSLDVWKAKGLIGIARFHVRSKDNTSALKVLGDAARAVKRQTIWVPGHLIDTVEPLTQLARLYGRLGLKAEAQEVAALAQERTARAAELGVGLDEASREKTITAITRARSHGEEDGTQRASSSRKGMPPSHLEVERLTYQVVRHRKAGQESAAQALVREALTAIETGFEGWDLALVHLAIEDPASRERADPSTGRILKAILAHATAPVGEPTRTITSQGALRRVGSTITQKCL